MRDVNIKTTLSLEKAIKILDCFSFDQQYCTIETICKLVGIPKTTAYRLLYTLEMNGLIHYNQDDATYCLGMKALHYGGVVLGRLDIRKVASPYITALHQKTGYSVTLSILEGDRLVFIDKCEGEGLGYTSSIGRSRDPHFGSPGRVLMAFLDEDKVEQMLEAAPLKKYTDFTLTDPVAFKQELHNIRQLGYGTDFDEIILGASAIAAPVRNRWNLVSAVVTVVGPTQSMKEYPTDALIQQVTECAKQISLAYSSGVHL